jgi:hypothetical protein
MIQDSQTFGSTDEHMVSRVFFDLLIDEKTYPNVQVNVKQTVGSSYDTAPLEVSRTEGYDGPLNHDDLQRLVEQYYRGLVGKAGSGIRISPNSSDIRMRNNEFVSRVEGQIRIARDGKAW